MVTYWWEPGNSAKVSPSFLVNCVSQIAVAKMLSLEGFGPRAPWTILAGKDANVAPISDIREYSQR